MDIHTLFESSFNLGYTYSSQEIKDIFLIARENGVTIPNAENPMAFTYNRWNKGMYEVLPCFLYNWNEYYEFVGFDYNYTGPIFHVPGKEEDRYIIGEFINGNYTFKEGFSSLDEWKQSDFIGFAVAEIGKKIDVLFDGNQIMKLLFVDSNNSSTINVTDEYRHVRAESNLGNRILGQSKGYSFEFNNHIYEILEVK